MLWHEKHIPDACSGYFEVTGTVTNIAEKPIDTVSLTVNFYDNKGNLLQSASASVYTLYLGESKDFSASVYEGESYFEQISDYKVVVTNVDLH